MSEEKKKVKGATSSSKHVKPARAKLHTPRTARTGGEPAAKAKPAKEPAVTTPADKMKPTPQPDIKPSAKMAEPVKPAAPAPVETKKAPSHPPPKPAMPKVSPKPPPPPAPVIQTLADRIDSEDKDIRALRSSDVVYYDKAVAEKVVEEKGKIVAKPMAIKGKPLLKKTFILKDQFKMRPAVRPVHKEAPERKITLTPPVTVKDISDKLGVKANVILQKLMGHNIMTTINDALSEDAIILIGLEFDYDITLEQPKDTAAHLAKVVADKPEDLRPRPPIVAFMGHVDHGKTSLLDRIRKTNVAAGEAGLITQHVGAYVVESAGKKIVFLDTPGHEAFTNMRARGANITDMVVLVVAADDGVMPQTEEAINHAKAANVAIIVAINKIDKREANVMKVKQQLSNLGLITEEWSGKTIFCEVSAQTGQGVDHLLEMILLQAEMMELKANPKRNAYGTILEAKLTEEHGVLMNGLVQSGTLRPRDIISCGKAYGKVRAMFDHTLKPVAEAAPSMPVQISGLSDLPEAGDKFYVVDSLQTAKELSESYQRKKDKGAEIFGRHLTLENLYSKISEDKIKEIKIIIKADVQGSVEVLAALLAGISTADVKVKIIHKGAGRINESDVILADASDAIIIGFNMTVDDAIKALAKQRGIDIKIYNVVYQVVEEFKLALEGLLEPEQVEVVTAHLTVKNTFKISKLGTIAGCQVSDGKIERAHRVRLYRSKKVIHDGKIASLKRLKDDVREVATGFECGLRLDGCDDVQVGDVIESYQIEKRMRKLSQIKS